jgi:DNA-binding transcriptional LysR family regulator
LHQFPLPTVEEAYDLAIRVGTLADSTSLTARRLGTIRKAICAAPSYLAEHGLPSSIDELSQHDGIVHTHAGRPEPWRVRHSEGRPRDVNVNSRLRFDDLQSVADAAVAGAGLAWLPCWLLGEYVRTGALTLVLDSSRVVSADVHAVWPQTHYLPSRTRVAIDALVAEIPAILSYPNNGKPITP